MTRHWKLLLGCTAALIGLVSPVAAYEVGEGCSVAGAFHTKNDANGAYHLVCNGSVWVSSSAFFNSGKIGASQYCDLNGANCFNSASAGTSSPSGGDRAIQFNNASSGFGGSSTFVYTSAGNLGIGTSSPVYLVQAKSSTAASTYLAIENTNASAQITGISLKNALPREWVILNNTIGTLVFSIGGSLGSEMTLTGNGTDYTTAIMIVGSGARIMGGYYSASATTPMYSYNSDTNTGMYFPGADALGFTTGGAQRFVLTSSGYAGVGISAPNAMLQINAASAGAKGLIVQGAASQSENLMEIQDSSGTAGFVFTSANNVYVGGSPTAGIQVTNPTIYVSRGSTTSKMMAATNAGAVGTVTNAPFYIVTNNVNRVTINGNNSYIGVNNTTPSGMLQVNTSSAGAKGVIVQGATSQTANLMEIQDSSGTVLNVFSSSGRLGIGKSTPAVALDVVGDINYTGEIQDVSDRRLKENIQPLSRQLEKISSLKGVSFTMKGDHQTELGLIAQDVEEIYPELVSTRSDGIKTMNYVGLIAPLVEAIKEQQRQIDWLREENADLARQLSELEEHSGSQ